MIFRDKRYGKEHDLSCNLNSNATLERYGLHITDIWDPQIRGLWGELSPCYTYHSKEKRDIGFPSRVRSKIAKIVSFRHYFNNC